DRVDVDPADDDDDEPRNNDGGVLPVPSFFGDAEAFVGIGASPVVGFKWFGPTGILNPLGPGQAIGETVIDVICLALGCNPANARESKEAADNARGRRGAWEEVLRYAELAAIVGGTRSVAQMLTSVEAEVAAAAEEGLTMKEGADAGEAAA